MTKLHKSILKSHGPVCTSHILNYPNGIIMKHTIQKEKEKKIKNLVKISMTRITIEKRRQGFPLMEVKNLFEIMC